MKLHILKNIPMLKTITLYFFKNFILLKKLKYQEISIWKQKYIQKNHELNQAKEKLMLSEAEFDSLSKEKNMMAKVIFKLYIYIINRKWNLVQEQRLFDQSF